MTLETGRPPPTFENMTVRLHFLSPAMRRRCSAGFTLLELTVVLFIMALFVTVAAVSFQGIDGEQVLREPAEELQRMAREAVRRAGMYEQPQVIVFDKHGFGTRYRDDVNATPENGGTTQWLRRVQIPEDISCQMKHWGQKEWKPAAGQRWMVQPSGLCEPLTVRLERGRSYIEMQFNPLTGGVAEEHMSIQP